jgi:hypothetical protein
MPAAVSQLFADAPIFYPVERLKPFIKAAWAIFRSLKDVILFVIIGI